MASKDLYRELPSVDEVLRSLSSKNGFTATALRNAARRVLDDVRSEIGRGELDESALRQRLGSLPQQIEAAAHRKPTLRHVINATGVILHTNLGRAPLSKASIEGIESTAGRFTNLEYDLATGERGKRDVHAQAMFQELLGLGTLTIVVNNCAAATLLALNGLAEAGEVIVSRGELVEIGGSFRVPEIMSKSGARLVEVGTTNRTRIEDYERAITPGTKLLMRVSRSNFEMIGFTEQPSLEELVALGSKHGVPVFEDHGNGVLLDIEQPALHSVQQSLAAGVDVVAYSGDKLVGGPQAGILSGKPEVVAKLRANPLFRALRVDKLTYAALSTTLAAHADEDYDALPALRMVRLSAESIRARAEQMLPELSARYSVEVVAGESVIGGGTPPSATSPTHLLAVWHEKLTAQQLQAKLRACDPPVVTRIADERVVLDLRTVFPDEEPALLASLLAVA